MARRQDREPAGWFSTPAERIAAIRGVTAVLCAVTAAIAGSPVWAAIAKAI
jgi:hypothetical protein